MASGRNDPCPCGSGAKYKKCCGRAQLPAPAPAASRIAAATTALPAQSAAADLTPEEAVHIRARIAAGQFAALEIEAGALTARRAHSGLAWKALGMALMMQDKDALFALQRAGQRPAES